MLFKNCLANSGHRHHLLFAQESSFFLRNEASQIFLLSINYENKAKGKHRKNIAQTLESSEERIHRKMLQYKQNVEKTIDQVSQTLHQKLEQSKKELMRGIHQAKEIASGAPLIVLDDSKKFQVMKARLETFGAYVNADGGGTA